MQPINLNSRIQPQVPLTEALLMARSVQQAQPSISFIPPSSPGHDTFFSGTQTTSSSRPSLGQAGSLFAANANKPHFGAGNKGKEKAESLSSSDVDSSSSEDEDDEFIAEMAKIPEEWKTKAPGKNISRSHREASLFSEPELLEDDSILGIRITNAYENYLSSPIAGSSSNPGDVRHFIAEQAHLDPETVADYLAKQADQLEQQAETLRLISGTAGRPQPGQSSTTTSSGISGIRRDFEATELQENSTSGAAKKRRMETHDYSHLSYEQRVAEAKHLVKEKQLTQKDAADKYNISRNELKGTRPRGNPLYHHLTTEEKLMAALHLVDHGTSKKEAALTLGISSNRLAGYIPKGGGLVGWMYTQNDGYYWKQAAFNDGTISPTWQLSRPVTPVQSPQAGR